MLRLLAASFVGVALGQVSPVLGNGKNGHYDVPTYDGADTDVVGNTDARAHLHDQPTRSPTADHDAYLPNRQDKTHDLNFDHSTNPERGNIRPHAEQVYHSPTMTPTKFPTKDATGCYWGEGVSWPVGYKGAGYANDYCNLWECLPGAVWQKQKRDCDLRSRARVGESPCSHTTCGYQDTCFMGELSTCRDFDFMEPKSGKKKKVVQVRTHHKEEKGGKHRCNWNLHHRSCMCMCHGTRRQDLPGFTWGNKRPLKEYEQGHVNYVQNFHIDPHTPHEHEH